ncbi:hypothetical protein JK361_35975 [Streptomyces sp. 5-8]|uniref:RCC1-like domain-containing protein n=1 Tax=Streptomyces musisoli TaxID=2802280 RepID=A0ABS1PC09_9ACTN|nr:RCC1 domain-containing protein [Streptomyces musisoli]MBL1109906.1 hypothetical protein [Streptomyces musisoli]
MTVLATRPARLPRMAGFPPPVTFGPVIAWGRHTEGQLNVPAAAQSGVVQVAAGGTHSVALLSDGRVVAWGDNASGQATVPPAAQSGVVQVAAGGHHSVALLSDGRVIAWGNNSSGQAAVPSAAQSGVVQVAVGHGHSLALLSDGRVIAWGNNSSGQATVPPAAQSGVVQVAAGYMHSLALLSDGRVIAWGNNSSGQATVPPAAQSGVVQVAGGAWHSVALLSDGRVIAWGNNSSGQATVPPAAQSGVVQVAGGVSHSLALLSDGRVIAWGNNSSGQANMPAGLRAAYVGLGPGSDHCLVVGGVPGGVESVVTVSGSGQETEPGTVFPEPLAVRVTGPAGVPVGGAEVSFTVRDAHDTGTGFPTGSPDTVTTGSDGTATTAVPLIAGPRTGPVEVVATAGFAEAVFVLDVALTTADQFVTVSGNNQQARPGTAFQPMTVRALRAGAPLAGLPVRFALSDTDSTGSTLPGRDMMHDTVTDGDGLASATCTAGAGEGDFLVIATGGGQSATLHATVGDPVAAHIVPLRGDGQSAVAASVFGAQLTAQVTTAGGTPVGGVVVEFTIESNPTGSFFLTPALASTVPALAPYQLADGSIDHLRPSAEILQAAGDRGNLAAVLQDLDTTGATSERVTTLDSNPADPAYGTATTHALMAGLTPGVFRVRATAPEYPDIPAAYYQLTVTAAGGIRLVIDSGNNQQEKTDRRFPKPCVVRVTNSVGQGLEDVTVTFRLTGTTGAVFPNGSASFTTATDPDGYAGSRAITADFPGRVYVNATCPGTTPAPAPIRFTLQAH